MSTSTDTPTTIAVWPDAPKDASDGADTVHLTPFLIGHDGTQGPRGAVIVLPGQATYRMMRGH